MPFDDAFGVPKDANLLGFIKLLTRKKASQKAEERGWINQMEGRENRSITQHDITSIEININEKDQWYARPAGIIMLTVASGLLLQIANLALGLI
jgi:hypothetical protein